MVLKKSPDVGLLSGQEGHESGPGESHGVRKLVRDLNSANLTSLPRSLRIATLTSLVL